jgi:diguanylate cyclase (GGDEF)-like protein
VTSPDTSKLRHFLMIEDAKGKRVVPLEATTYTIGRDRTNTIVLHSREVSRQHAILLRVTNPKTSNFLFRIIDGNLQGKKSTNGLIINTQRLTSHDLQRDDVILFGTGARARYMSASNLTDADVAMITHTGDVAKIKVAVESAASDPLQTLFVEDDDSRSVSEAAIIRLASIPELAPNPIVEIDLSGNITYLNPFAIRKFPDIREAGLKHAILAGLLTVVQENPEEILVREVSYGAHVFEQYIHYISESDLIRSYIFDITERKRSDLEIRRRDALLHGVAEATHHLLGIVTQTDFEPAIERALKSLGLAAGVDRVHIYHHHPHPSGAISRSIRHEWARDGVQPTIHTLDAINQSYVETGHTRWYETLASGQTISGLTSEFPAVERVSLERNGVLSVLMTPIFVHEQCWGYISFDECKVPRRWSTSEESILFTMATSLGNTIQRRRTEEAIQYQAVHDALTGLPNRILFEDQLSRSLSYIQGSDQMLAVMFLDIDRFKTINDTLGHTYGDNLLKAISERLKGCLRDREKDMLAHWGGDEFLILINQVPHPQDVAKVAQRILAALKEPFEIGNQELHITASTGLAIYPIDAQDAESLIKHADIALYRAKENGRNNFQFYTPAMSTNASQVFAVEKQLYRALERGEFSLAYQPQISLQTCDIIGVEALLRWKNPELGMVSPATFIPLMEENGLIIPIGEWVLRTACAQNKAWQDAGIPAIAMSVNLSVKQFRHANLVALITQILNETNLDPRLLDLEITESIAIQDVKYTISVMEQLRDMGVRLSMDDFGTGYSSLSYLSQFPLDTLKIDKSFVNTINDGMKGSEVVTAVIAIARALNLKVIAEGVETEEQLEFLHRGSCEAIQGFLLGKPMPVEQVTEFLIDHWPILRQSLLNRLSSSQTVLVAPKGVQPLLN